MDNRLALKPVQVGEALQVSRSKAYELIASGEIPSIKVGGCKRVPLTALQEWIARRLAERAAQQ